MKIILLSAPDFIPSEIQAVNLLLEKEGIFAFHLRKPDCEVQKVADFLSEINPLFYSRIMIHTHHSLAAIFPIKGVHFGGSITSGSVFLGNSLESKTCSRAVHSLAELQQFGKKYDYYLLSPIFDSISKKGYHSAFSAQTLKTYFENKEKDHPPVFALGGISPDTIPIAKSIGFQGVAVLGFLWENFRKNRNLSELSDRYDLLLEKVISDEKAR